MRYGVPLGAVALVALDGCSEVASDGIAVAKVESPIGVMIGLSTKTRIDKAARAKMRACFRRSH